MFHIGINLHTQTIWTQTTRRYCWYSLAQPVRYAGPVREVYKMNGHVNTFTHTIYVCTRRASAHRGHRISPGLWRAITILYYYMRCSLSEPMAQYANVMIMTKTLKINWSTALTMTSVLAFGRLQRDRVQLILQIHMVLGHVPRQKACKRLGR